MKLVNILSEGYKEQKELSDLTTEICAYVTSTNYKAVKDFYAKYVFMVKHKEHLSKFSVGWLNYDHFLIRDAVDDVSKYKYLGDMLNDKYSIGDGQFTKKKLYMYFTSQLPHGTGGEYNSGDVNRSSATVRILFPTDDFHELLTYNYGITYHNYGMEYTKDELERSFKSSFGASYRRIIMHELQHAYDDYRSGGKYVKDKESITYYKTKTDDFPTGERLKQYYGLPHEYWARFSDVIPRLSSTIGRKPFDETAADFKRKVGGWDDINKDGQQRLLRALYKLWDERRTK